jgi:PUA-domain protein
MKKVQLSKSDLKNLNKEIEDFYFIADFFSKKDKIEKLIFDDIEIIARDGNFLFFFYNGIIVPTLKLLQDKNLLKSVIVDMGAVPFVIKGADIMRPGIRGWDEEISKDMVVSIVDENNKKPIGVGKMLVSGEELSLMEKGKIIKSIHYVGDAIWNLR